MMVTEWQQRNFVHYFKFYSLIIVLYIFSECLAVDVENVTIVADSGRDYVLDGEGVTLHCNYQLDDDEELYSVTWYKFGKEKVYEWIPSSQRPPLVTGSLTNRVKFLNKDLPLSSIYVPKAYYGMNGEFQCEVSTRNDRIAKKSAQLRVVKQCEESVWNVKTNATTCSETYYITCTSIYPKPYAACGVYDTLKETFTDLQMPKISRLGMMYNFMFATHIKANTIEDKKNSVFRCFVTVEDTSWKYGQIKPFFDSEKGCKDPPVAGSGGKYTVRGNRTCMDLHAESSVAEYSCPGGFVPPGKDTLVCRNRSWVYRGTISDGPSTRQICSGCLIARESLLVYVIAGTILITGRKLTDGNL